MEIPPASTAPIQFQGKAYIRVGEATPLLSEFPERERLLWQKLQPIMWEQGVATSFATSDEVLSLLDYPSYFKLTDQRLPDNREGILRGLEADGLITRDISDRWNIMNVGAILFAVSLRSFDRIARKQVRIIQYLGKTRAGTAREHQIEKGYASGFSSFVEVVQSLLPINEHIEKALRKEVSLYPEIALRELIANALIHQDLTITGAGPTIEIYNDRMEITNPGKPLVDVADSSVLLQGHVTNRLHL